MTTTQAFHRRDRWADVAVIALVVMALTLGLLVRELALFRTTSFSIGHAGVSGRRPAAWMRESGDDPLLRVRDTRGGEFDTVLELRSRPLAADAEPAMALDALALERAGQVTAYRTLDTDRVLIGAETATRRTFAYVYEDNNPYVDRLPVVVRGMDLALRDEGRVIVATLLADAESFDDHYRYFRAFAESLEF
jgi:hypothetical protein